MSDEFTQAYIAAALWSTTDPDTEDNSLDQKYGAQDFAPATLEAIERDCAAFQKDNAKLLAKAHKDSGLTVGRSGFCFFMSRSGSGTGFFDEGLGATGDKLQKAAVAFGEFEIYPGDDGKLYAVGHEDRANEASAPGAIAKDFNTPEDALHHAAHNGFTHFTKVGRKVMVYGPTAEGRTLSARMYRHKGKIHFTEPVISKKAMPKRAKPIEHAHHEGEHGHGAPPPDHKVVAAQHYRGVPFKVFQDYEDREDAYSLLIEGSSHNDHQGWHQDGFKSLKDAIAAAKSTIDGNPAHYGATDDNADTIPMPRRHHHPHGEVGAPDTPPRDDISLAQYSRALNAAQAAAYDVRTKDVFRRGPAREQYSVTLLNKSQGGTYIFGARGDSLTPLTIEVSPNETRVTADDSIGVRSVPVTYPYGYQTEVESSEAHAPRPGDRRGGRGHGRGIYGRESDEATADAEALLKFPKRREDDLVKNPAMLPKSLASLYVREMKKIGMGTVVEIVDSHTTTPRGWDYGNVTDLKVTTPTGEVVAVDFQVRTAAANAQSGPESSGIASLSTPGVLGHVISTQRDPDPLVVAQRLASDVVDQYRVRGPAGAPRSRARAPVAQERGLVWLERPDGVHWANATGGTFWLMPQPSGDYALTWMETGGNQKDLGTFPYATAVQMAGHYNPVTGQSDKPEYRQEPLPGQQRQVAAAAGRRDHEDSSEDLDVEFGNQGPVRVAGPAYRMVELPVGAEGKHGPITEHTPAWARIGYEKISDRVTMQRPKQSGHEIEGKVWIKGKLLSAFTSGGENPDGGNGMIIVRTKGLSGTSDPERFDRHSREPGVEAPHGRPFAHAPGEVRDDAFTYDVGDRVEVNLNSVGPAHWVPAEVVTVEDGRVWVKLPSGHESDLYSGSRIRRVSFHLAEGPAGGGSIAEAGRQLPKLEYALLIGPAHAKDTLRLRQFLSRNGHPFQFFDTEQDEGDSLIRQFGLNIDDLPAIVWKGHKYYKPANREIADILGFGTQVEGAHAYDVLIVGAGPAGLSCAVYAASEGLSCLVIEAYAPGGQAANSSRIENYAGFPRGISGADLAAQTYLQAQKFGARFIVPSSADRLIKHGVGDFEIRLSDRSSVHGKSVVLACGAEWRKPNYADLPKFEGAGVYYAATATEGSYVKGQDVVVVGGGNSAGQAAIFMSDLAHKVFLIVRGKGLSDTMSDYLIKRITKIKNIELLAHTEIVSLQGVAHLERVTWKTNGVERTEAVRHLFLMIGTIPKTDWLHPDGKNECAPKSGWLGNCVTLDEGGFVKTGADLTASEWNHPRKPMAFETSMPGTFAVGDVRSGSVKRVATAVGDGAVVITSVHKVLLESANVKAAE